MKKSLILLLFSLSMAGYVYASGPILSDIRCQYSTSDNRRVINGGGCTSTAPHFSWDIVYNTSQIVSYSISWSTHQYNVLYNKVVPSTVTFFNPEIKYGLQAQTTATMAYYLTVKAKDSQNQESNSPVKFTYIFSNDKTPLLTPQANTEGVAYNGTDYGVPLNMVMKFIFGKSILTDTIIPANIYLETVANEFEVSTSSRISPNLSYDVSLATVTVVTVSTTLPSNWTYDLVISTRVQDINMNSLTSEFRRRFRTMMSKNLQSAIKVSDLKTAGQKASVMLSAGSLLSDGYILMNDNPIDAPLKASTKSIMADAQAKISNTNKPNWYIEMNMYDNNKQLIISSYTLSVAVPLTMTYVDNDNNGIIDGTSIRVDSLSIWWLDETKELWSKVPSTIDKPQKTITASINHLSVYALMGAINLSVDDVMVAPVPWIPEDGVNANGTLAGGITFRNLPYEGEIRLFTVSGELVRKINIHTFTDPSGYSWDGKNEDGAYVASGVYLWVVKSDQGKKTGKLIVVR